MPKFKTRKALDLPGATHELTFSTFKRTPHFNDPVRSADFVRALAAARRRWNFEVWAFVVMPDHVHVVVWPREERYRIADFLKAVKMPVAKSAVAQWRLTDSSRLSMSKVARPSGRTEHRFWQQGGGYDRILETRSDVSKAIDYLHWNPVRAGLCAKPEEWPWSSARWYMGVAGDLEMPVDRWHG